EVVEELVVALVAAQLPGVGEAEVVVRVPAVAQRGGPAGENAPVGRAGPDPGSAAGPDEAAVFVAGGVVAGGDGISKTAQAESRDAVRAEAAHQHRAARIDGDQPRVMRRR